MDKKYYIKEDIMRSVLEAKSALSEENLMEIILDKYTNENNSKYVKSKFSKTYRALIDSSFIVEVNKTVESPFMNMEIYESFCNQKNGFVLNFVYNKDAEDDEYTVKENTYHLSRTKNADGTYICNKRVDEIRMNSKRILIIGKRSSLKNLSDMVSDGSSLYKEIRKACVYTYLKYRRKFSPNAIHYLRKSKNNDSEIQPRDLLLFDMFSIDLCESEKIDSKAIDALFDNRCNKNFEVSLTHYISGINGNTKVIDSFWKSMNRIYVILSGKKKDDEGIRELINSVVSNFNNNDLISEYCRKKKSLKRINYYLLVKNIIGYKLGGKKGLNDKRYDELIYCLEKCGTRDNIETIESIIKKEGYLSDYNEQEIKEGKYKQIELKIQEVNSLIDSIKNETSNDDIRKEISLLIKYIYIKRCKYFHGESYNPMFLLRDNKQMAENTLFNNFLKILIRDTYHSEVFRKKLVGETNEKES